MAAKRSKYDTNPLDEKVADHAQDVWGYSSPETLTEDLGAATREIGRAAPTLSPPDTEAPTRRIGVTSYPSVFIPPALKQPLVYQPPPSPPPNVYLPPPMPVIQPSSSRTVSGLGIPEKWAVILPYLPFYLAIVAAIGELLLVPRTETRVRFHAAQGLALQIGITALSTVLGFAGLISSRFSGAGLFSAASTIFLIIAMVRVWKDRPFNVPPLDGATKWLDQHIKPRK